MLKSKSLIDYLSLLIERYLGSTFDQNKWNDTSPFHANKIPEITITEYLKRVNLYLFGLYHDSEKVTLWMCTLILLTRYRDLTKVSLNWHNIHRLIAVSALLACKTVMDESYNNEVAARVFGIPLNKCNQLEINFLLSINFSCEITENNYTSFIEYFKNVILSRNPNLKQKNIEFPNFEKVLGEPKVKYENNKDSDNSNTEHRSIVSVANDLEKTLSLSTQTPLTFSQTKPALKLFGKPKTQPLKTSKPSLSQVPIKRKVT